MEEPKKIKFFSVEFIGGSLFWLALVALYCLGYKALALQILTVLFATALPLIAIAYVAGGFSNPLITPKSYKIGWAFAAFWVAAFILYYNGQKELVRNYAGYVFFSLIFLGFVEAMIIRNKFKPKSAQLEKIREKARRRLV